MLHHHVKPLGLAARFPNNDKRDTDEFEALWTLIDDVWINEKGNVFHVNAPTKPIATVCCDKDDALKTGYIKVQFSTKNMLFRELVVNHMLLKLCQPPLKLDNTAMWSDGDTSYIHTIAESLKDIETCHNPKKRVKPAYDMALKAQRMIAIFGQTKPPVAIEVLDAMWNAVIRPFLPIKPCPPNEADRFRLPSHYYHRPYEINQGKAEQLAFKVAGDYGDYVVPRLARDHDETGEEGFSAGYTLTNKAHNILPDAVSNQLNVPITDSSNKKPGIGCVFCPAGVALRNQDHISNGEITLMTTNSPYLYCAGGLHYLMLPSKHVERRLYYTLDELDCAAKIKASLGNVYMWFAQFGCGQTVVHAHEHAIQTQHEHAIQTQHEPSMNKLYYALYALINVLLNKPKQDAFYGRKEAWAEQATRFLPTSSTRILLPAAAQSTNSQSPGPGIQLRAYN